MELNVVEGFIKLLRIAYGVVSQFQSFLLYFILGIKRSIARTEFNIGHNLSSISGRFVIIHFAIKYQCDFIDA